jgi:hypothetical protein
MQQDLSQKLIATGYTDLFLRSDYNAVNEIWAGENALEELHKIITNDAEPVLTRFLASEILFYKDNSFPSSEKEKKTLAGIYVKILSNGGTINGNIWGLPGFTGIAGEHLLKAGREENITLLKQQLDNQQSVLYDGSREATFGNEYGYRVKDIAAFYLGILLNLPYVVLKEPARRDAAIEQLKQNLP